MEQDITDYFNLIKIIKKNINDLNSRLDIIENKIKILKKTKKV
jgi:hypothetical protein